MAAIFGTVAFAQETPSRPDRGVMPGASYSVSDIEKISLTNGNLNLSVPLASLPPIAGGKLKFTLSAIYNSKLWNVMRHQHQEEWVDGCGTWNVNTPQLSDVGGWRVSGIYSLTLRNAQEDFEYVIPRQSPAMDCEPIGTEVILLQNQYHRMILVTPDGAEHELRPVDYPSFPGLRRHLKGYFKDTPDSLNTPVRYYSFDGSFLYAVVNPSSYPTLWTIYLNDGTKVTQYSNGIQRISDTNGNSIKVFADSAGTHYQDEQTGREIKATYDPAGNNGQGQTKVWYQTVGGGWLAVDINFGTTQVQGKAYRVSDWQFGGGEGGEDIECYHGEVLGTTIPVIREIVFPITESGVSARRFTFAYNSDTTASATDQVSWACGQAASTYTRTVSIGNGALSQMITPFGATVKYSYSRDSVNTYLTSPLPPNDPTDDIPRETITQKQILHDGQTDTWTYQIDELMGTGGTVTAPDGSVSTETSYAGDPVHAMFMGQASEKSGLVYRSNRSGVERVERHWTTLVFSGANFGATGSLGNVTFNPVVDAEYRSLLDANGNPVKMAAKTYQHDFNGNLIQQTDYDWFDPSLVSRDAQGVPTGVPAGATVLRVVNNDYYNSATSSSSGNVYAKRSISTATPVILNAPQQTTVGPSIVRVNYDGQGYGVAPTVGNLTSQSVWDDLDNKWITASSTYGLYGNLATSTDARAKVTQFFYDDAMHALPNRVVVDPQNGTGTQTATTAFDYSTGLVTSATDANGNTATIDYTNQLLGTVDPFGRPGLAIGPLVNVNGVNQHHRTTTIYEDHLSRLTVAADLNAENDQLLKSRATTDMLGRPILTEQTEDGTNYTIYSRKAHDQMGKITYASSPMRYNGSASTDSWTRVTNDNAGRTTEVATFGGSTQPASSGTSGIWTGSVTTAYDTQFTTVTDQAGKPRRSMVDGLGRLVRIDEPDGSNNLGSTTSPTQPTSYGYNVSGNLTNVAQGSQTRTFNYDSLSRLRSAINPESGTITYTYDDNGNLLTRSDARSIVTTYGYDALNRVTSRSYSDGTPTVSYAYDTAGLANSKGKLTSVSSSVSTYSYSGFDAMGRVGGGTQTLGSQTYSPSYGYYLSGHIKTITYPSGRTVGYTYDNAGRANSFTGNLGGGANRNYATGIIYDAAGRMTKEQLSTTTPIYNKLFYNSRGQLAEIRESTSYTGPTDTSFNRGAIINSYSTCWGMCAGQSMPGNNGNLKRQEVYIPDNDQIPTTSYHLLTEQFEYDSLNRLKRVFDDGDTWRQEYAYDRYGNRSIDGIATHGNSINNMQASVVQNTITNRMYAPGETEVNHPLINYDAVGNQIKDYYSDPGNLDYDRTYDAENRMKSSVATSGTQTSSYSYDGDGRRVKRIVNGAETWQVYGLGGELLAEYPLNGSAASPQKEYGYRNGQLLITATVGTSWGSPPLLNDNPLMVGETTVQSRHITELRAAINALRTHMGLSAFSWQQPAEIGDLIKADPIVEMRTALDQALGAPSPSYSVGLAQWLPIKASHIQELRDRVLAAWSSGSSLQLNWLVADQLGTPRMIFDQTGSLATVSRHDYLPFGEELYAGTGGRALAQGYTNSDGTRQKFTSYERDYETSLDYAHARYYGNTQGRFTSPDPYVIFFEMKAGRNAKERSQILGEYISQPQNWDRYSYSINDPINLVDPTGLIWVHDTDKDLYIFVKDDEYSAGNQYYDDQSKYVPVVNDGPNGIKFTLGELQGSANTPENQALVGQQVYLGKDGNVHAVDPPSASGSMDLNLSFGTLFFVGLTGGAMFDRNGGPYPYIGGGLMPPGPSGSVTFSPDNVSGGFNGELQGGYLGYGSVGVDEAGNSFTGAGVGYGASLTGYIVFGAARPPHHGPHRPNYSNAAVNSNISHEDRHRRSNCSCNQ